MNRIPDSPPLIEPLPAGIHRPLWSVMVPVYNCIGFLEEALMGILNQDPGEERMQIQVVDDASTDGDVAALVARVGKGRIHYFRQPENVGSVRNFETCIRLAKGILVHLHHGDDRLRAGFYETIQKLFKCYPEAGAAFSRFCFMDETGRVTGTRKLEEAREGILPNWLCRIGEFQRIQYISMVVKREVYEQLGTFYGMNYAEDWEMWVRIAKYYPVAYTPELLAEYRTHDHSISGSKVLQGKHMDDISKAIRLIGEWMPAESRNQIARRSRRYYSRVNLSIANSVWERTRDRKRVMGLIARSMSMSAYPLVYYHAARLIGRMIVAKPGKVPGHEAK